MAKWCITFLLSPCRMESVPIVCHGQEFRVRAQIWWFPQISIQGAEAAYNAGGVHCHPGRRSRCQRGHFYHGMASIFLLALFQHTQLAGESNLCQEQAAPALPLPASRQPPGPDGTRPLHLPHTTGKGEVPPTLPPSPSHATGCLALVYFLRLCCTGGIQLCPLLQSVCYESKYVTPPLPPPPLATLPDLWDTVHPRVCPRPHVWGASHHRHWHPLLPCLPWHGQCEGSHGHQCRLPLPGDAKAVHEGVGRQDYQDGQPRLHHPCHPDAVGRPRCLANIAAVSLLPLFMVISVHRSENDIDTLWALPVGLFLTSFGWWECFVQEQGTWSK